MYDSSREPYTISGPLKFKGQQHNGLHLSNKYVEHPTTNNYECFHLEDLKDFHAEDLKGFNIGKNMMRLWNVRDGLVENIDADGASNAEQNFCILFTLAKGVHNVTFKNIRMGNVAYGGTASYANGDCFALERGATGIMAESVEGFNPTDAVFDLKSDMVIRDFDLTGGGRFLIRVWNGAKLTLVNGSLRGPVGSAAIQLVGNTTTTEQGKVEYYNVDFAPDLAGKEFFFEKNYSNPHEMPNAEIGWVELPADPYPNGIPLYVPGTPVPAPTPEPPMSSLPAEYVFFANQSETKTIGESGEYAYGSPPGTGGTDDTYFFKTLLPGTYGPKGAWDETFGDPNNGYAKTIYVKDVAVPVPPPTDGLTEDRVREIIAEYGVVHRLEKI